MTAGLDFMNIKYSLLRILSTIHWMNSGMFARVLRSFLSLILDQAYTRKNQQLFKATFHKPAADLLECFSGNFSTSCEVF